MVQLRMMEKGIICKIGSASCKTKLVSKYLPLYEEDNRVCYYVESNEGTFTCNSVFDKLIWHTIAPKNFLFGTAHFGQMVQLIIIILSLTALILC